MIRAGEAWSGAGSVDGDWCRVQIVGIPRLSERALVVQQMSSKINEFNIKTISMNLLKKITFLMEKYGGFREIGIYSFQ